MTPIRNKAQGSARSSGRKEKLKRVVQALAVAGAIAAGAHAYAAPVRFDNPAHGAPGHFHWARPEGDNSNFLDMTAAADAQPGTAFTAKTLGHAYIAGTAGFVHNDLAPIELEIADAEGNLLAGLASGALVPGAHEWFFNGKTYSVASGSDLPEGVQTYLGVRFDTGSGWQYGWIGVVRTVEQVEAFAWGHETDPGVPIAAGAEGGGGESVPTVSEWGLAIMSLSLLAAGTWVLRKQVPRTGRPPA